MDVFGSTVVTLTFVFVDYLLDCCLIVVGFNVKVGVARLIGGHVNRCSNNIFKILTTFKQDGLLEVNAAT